MRVFTQDTRYDISQSPDLKSRKMVPLQTSDLPMMRSRWHPNYGTCPVGNLIISKPIIVNSLFRTKFGLNQAREPTHRGVIKHLNASGSLKYTSE